MLSAFLLFQLTILIFSVIIHEVSHGLVAFRLGDPTAKLAGRLTLNPLKHLDPFGSFLLPIMLYVVSAGSFVFGWARPVPYNPNFLKNPKQGGGLIALAGPASNLLLAAVCGALVRLLILFPVAQLPEMFIYLLEMVVATNIVLAIFNLVPIAPLDGSKILFAFLPNTPALCRAQMVLERYGIILLFAFIFFGFDLLIPIITLLFRLFTGQPLA